VNFAGTSISNINIRGVTSLSAQDCFLRLDGGVQDAYVRGSYAQGNSRSTAISCTPSVQGSASGAFGVQGLYVAGSSFYGFARGFSFTASQSTISDIYLDDLYLAVVANGPGLEFFSPIGSSSTFSNINVSNSTFQSASTACVLHGGAGGIRISNVTCSGSVPAPVPAGCGSFSAARGFALVELSGTATSSQTVSITVNPGSITASTTTAVGETAAQVATALGSAINASSLVTAGCPLLVPIETFNDAAGPSDSIGRDIEVYSYVWSPTTSTTVSVNATHPGTIGITLPNVASTFAPPDSVYVGAPSSPAPNVVTFSRSRATMAQYGAGVHVEGGASLTFDSNLLSDATSPNAYGVQVDTAGAAYSNVLFHSNDVANATSPVLFNTGSGSGLGPAIRFIDNNGFNPTPQQSASISCNTVTTNPFPFSVQIYVSGVFTSVEKNGSQIYAGSSGAQSVDVLLGVGESVEIMCSGTAPTSYWFGS
jgi:hypothetical protein